MALAPEYQVTGPVQWQVGIGRRNAAGHLPGTGAAGEWLISRRANEALLLW